MLKTLVQAVSGKINPQVNLVDTLNGGEFTVFATVEGGTVEVTRDGENIEVGDASVICGGVQTANATVYSIDKVLMSPARPFRVWVRARYTRLAA